MLSIKTWNVRDQTREALNQMLEKQYKEIEASYKMLRKVSDVNDARKIIDEIWRMKSFVNTIEMEQIRRDYNEAQE